MVVFKLSLHISSKVLAFLTVFLFLNSAIADTFIVEKQRFSVKNFKTTSGITLPEIQIGWEAYGTLNKDKSNAILISHYFLGTSHAAGKYAKSDKHAGYWDAIIGPGKAIDTNKYYVISTDILGNTNVKDPNVFTTGPSSINPETNKAYGLSFPVLTILDMVNAEKELVTNLGISTLYATAGMSQGALQSLEWSSTYPDMVQRVIAVCAIAEADSLVIADLENWAMPIKTDPLWNKGDYYESKEPINGLTNSMQIIVKAVYHGYIFDRRFKSKMIEDDAPKKSILNEFKVNEWIGEYATYRASKADANHILYYIRANQLFRLGDKKTLAEGIAPIKAKLLLLPSKNDALFALYHMKSFYTQLLIQKKDVTYDEIEGPWGHLDGIYAIATKSKLIKKFLED